MENSRPKTRRPSLDEIMSRIKWPFNRFFLFLLIAVLFALVMGFASYKIYEWSDAASLDLSSPEYQRLRQEATHSKDEPVLSASGEINRNFVHQVISASDYYRNQLGDAKPFADEALLDENLINSLTKN